MTSSSTSSVPRGAALGPAHGTALYLGAVLGPGVMALPALGVAVAGPASLVAWVALIVVSVPVAVCFGALAARHPDAGGISSFVGRAFGPRAAAVVGWWFYAAVPVGIVAGALVGGHYVVDALDWPPLAVHGVAAVLLAGAFVANHVGLQVSSALQLALVAALVVLLVATVVLAAPHASAANFRPFAPYGWRAIGAAAVVLFYAFTGWEAASHLSAEFARQTRDLPRVTAATLLLVSVLYLALVLTTIGVLGSSSGSSNAPLLHLLEAVAGPVARPVTAVVAVLLSLGALNTFVAGGARLGTALGRDGALPAWLALGTRPGHEHRRSLAVQGVLTAVTLLVSASFTLDLDVLMPLTTVLLAAVTCAGMLAAIKLLTTPLLRVLARVAAAFTLVVLGFCTVTLLVPALVAGLALLSRWTHDRRSPVERRV